MIGRAAVEILSEMVAHFKMSANNPKLSAKQSFPRHRKIGLSKERRCFRSVIALEMSRRTLWARSPAMIPWAPIASMAFTCSIKSEQTVNSHGGG